MFVYDAEIIRAIQNKNEARLYGIEYCAGWHDFENMGISVVCGYDYLTDRYRVFMQDNFDELQDIFADCRNAPFVGFNSIAFDNNLFRANNIRIDDNQCYDILREIWISDGLDPDFEYPSHLGYGLNDTLKANFTGIQK
jgi:hypothetical protein